MKKTITTFYSLTATLLILEFLLLLWSVAFYRVFFNGPGTIVNDHLVIRVLILAFCSLTLGGMYGWYFEGNKLTGGSYWTLLGLHSAASIYLAYSRDVIAPNYLKANTVLTAISLLTWVMLLLLGILYQSFSKVHLENRL